MYLEHGSQTRPGIFQVDVADHRLLFYQGAQSLHQNSWGPHFEVAI